MKDICYIFMKKKRKYEREEKDYYISTVFVCIILIFLYCT